jgi:hypothetical protein
MTELRDLEIVAAALERLGFRLVGAGSRWGDSGTAEFTDGQRPLVIEKDRGQWMLAGVSPDQAEAFGLGGMFERTEAFVALLERFARATGGDDGPGPDGLGVRGQSHAV